MELNLTNNQKLVAYIVAIVAIMAFCIYLITLDARNAAFLALAAVACWPMAKFVWAWVREYQANPIRLLKRNLPKAGFSIDNTQWEENGTRLAFIGRFHEYNYVFRAYTNAKTIEIFYMAFAEFEATNPNIAMLHEAINETAYLFAMEKPEQTGTVRRRWLGHF